MTAFYLAIAFLLGAGIVDKFWGKRIHELRVMLATRDAALEGMEQQTLTLDNQIKWTTGRLDDAHATILELKREGFAPPEAVQVALPPTTPGSGLATEVKDAIHSIARPGDPLYNRLVAQAETESEREGADPTEIAAQITKGSSFNPWW